MTLEVSLLTIPPAMAWGELEDRELGCVRRLALVDTGHQAEVVRVRRRALRLRSLCAGGDPGIQSRPDRYEDGDDVVPLKGGI